MAVPCHLSAAGCTLLADAAPGRTRGKVDGASKERATVRSCVFFGEGR